MDEADNLKEKIEIYTIAFLIGYGENLDKIEKFLKSKDFKGISSYFEKALLEWKEENQ